MATANDVVYPPSRLRGNDGCEVCHCEEHCEKQLTKQSRLPRRLAARNNLTLGL